MTETQRLEIAFVSPLTIVSEPLQGRQFLIIALDNGFVVTAEGEQVMYTLPVGMSVKMQVAYVDSGGNPASIDGDVTWQSSDESILRLAVEDDSSICRAIPAGPAGQAQVTATADADLGDGTRELVTIADIQVVAGEAVAGVIQPVGEPEPLQPTQHRP